MEPIDEDFMIRPGMCSQSAFKLTSVNSRLDQNSFILGHCIMCIGGIISREASINDDYQSLIVGVERINKTWQVWEVSSVYSEVSEVIHVRDVQVDCIQRHSSVRIGLDHIFNLGLGVIFPR